MPTFTQYLQQANDTLLTIVQIETQEALDAVDQIAAVDGIDVLFIGPFDLGGFPLLSGRLYSISHQHGTNYENVQLQATTLAIPLLEKWHRS